MRKHYLLLTIAALALGGCSIIRPSGHGTTTGQPAGTSSSEPGGSGTEPGGSTSGGTSVIPGTSSTDPVPGGSSSSVAPTPSGVITLNSYSESLDVYDEASNHTFQLEATITDPAYNVYTLGWRTTNSSIIHITQQGLVTAVGVESGKSSSTEYAYACLFDGSEEVARSEYCTFVVTDSTPNPSYITKVAFQGDKNPFIDVGETPEYTVFVSGVDGDDHYNRKCSFENDNSEVVSIQEIETGVDEASKVRITALKGGTAHVTAKSIQDPTKTDVIEVEVDPAITGIQEVKSAPASVAKGGSINPDNVVLVVTLDNGGTREVTAWSVTCDTSTVGDNVEAKAYVQGHSEFYGTLYVRVYEGTVNTYTFVDKNYNDNADASLSTFEAVTAGSACETSGSARGVQTTSALGKSECKTKTAIGGMTQIDVTYSTNNSTGTIKVFVGESEVKSISVGGTVNNYTEDIQLPSTMSGVVSLKVNNTGSKSIYVKSVAISTIHMLDGIGVLTEGKTDYIENESFDLTGFVIVPKYTDGLGDASEAFDHSELTYSPTGALAVTDDSVRITHGTDYVDVPITVTGIPLTDFSCTLPASIEGATIEGNEISVNLNQAISFEFAVGFTPSDASDKRIEYSSTISDSSKISFTGNAVSFLGLASAETFEITAKPLGKPSSAVKFTVKVFDVTAPVLQSITIQSVDTSSVKAEQYEGKEFDGTGFTLAAHYSNGKEDVILNGATDVLWYDCVLGENPKLYYSDEFGELDDYAIDVSAYVTIIKNELTIIVDGTLTKSEYELSESWDPTGIEYIAAWDSGEDYEGPFSLSFDPATPAVMGVGSGSLTITVSAEGYSESIVCAVTVNSDSKTNTTHLENGDYYITYTNNTTKYYMSGVASGKGTLTTDKSLALAFSFELVGNDEWAIKASGKYLSITNGATNLYLNSTSEVRLNIGWDAGVNGARTLYNSANNRYVSFYSSGTDLRTYTRATDGTQGLVFEPAKALSSITGISGSVSGRAGNAFDTSNLIVSGLYEGESVPKNITSFVNITCDPATAAEGVTSVQVTATYKDDPTKTLTQSVSASVRTEAIWQQSNTLSVGDQFIIVSKAYTAVLAGISSSKGVADQNFDDDKALQDFVLTVVEGNQSGTVAFKTPSGAYLKYSSSNDLSTEASVTDNSSWIVEFDSNDNIVIKTYSNSSRTLQYNSSQPRFVTYTSTQKAIQIYKKVL